MDNPASAGEGWVRAVARQAPSAAPPVSDTAILPVSVVVTVLNERDSIGRLLESLLRQDRAPREVIVVDGGSTDGTQELVRRFAGNLHPDRPGGAPRPTPVAVQLPDAGCRPPTTPIRLIVRPDSNISAGRNEGIEAAQSEIVAVTDAGVRLGADWLRLITAPLLGGGAGVDVVSGFFVADPQSLFERAMGATVLPSVEEIDAASFLPSSRSIAFRKSVWKQIGGYPEWLDYCEDIVFDLTLRRSLGARFVFEPRAVAYFRPRQDISSFFRQYYRYARGDGKANLWPRRHLARYASYLFLLATLRAFVGTRGSGERAARARLMGLTALIGGALYLRRPIVRLLDEAGDASAPRLAAMLALLPLIRLSGDVAKMLGYPAGWFWRLRRDAGSAAEKMPRRPPVGPRQL